MQIIEKPAYTLEYTNHAQEIPYVTAIVVAAGNATRMGGSKQLIPLMGIPVIARSMLAFQRCELIKDMVVVAREDEIADIQALADQYAVTRLRAIVPGGKDRQQSVAAGVEASSPNTACYAIHDGARPLVTGHVIEAVLQTAFKKKAAAAGVYVKDTIKQVDSSGRVLSTPDRSSLVAVQTPQAFEAALYRRVLQAAAAEDAVVTDDCSLCEREGVEVYIVNGSYSNIKITTREDIAVAESILLRGEE